MRPSTSFLVVVLFSALVGCDSTPSPQQEPAPAKVEPAPAKAEPAAPKAEPAPPKVEPEPPKAEPAQPKAEPVNPPVAPEPPRHKYMGVANCKMCHVTAYGAPAEFLGPKFDPRDGVQCETCHGPAGDYWKKEVMKDKEKARSLGLVLPDEGLCKTCHNSESPAYKEFKFEESLSMIAHPVPEK